MKYLILLLLFITSCTDKKQTTEPVVIEPIIAEVIKPEPIKLSYDKGLDLMLIYSSFYNSLHQILKNAEEGLGYSAIYWDSNNNTYYTIDKSGTLVYPISVTNTNFIYTLDEEKQYEPVFHLAMKEVFTNTGSSLLYIGSVSPLERVYLDPTNQQYYIKELTPWDNSIYTVYTNSTTRISTNIVTYQGKTYTNTMLIDNGDGVDVTNTNTSSVYPYLGEYDISSDYTNILGISFTNTNQELFGVGYIGNLLYYNGKITNK